MKAFLVTLLGVVPTLAAPFFEVRGAEYAWAAIGDSFAAGVAYKDEVQYDANKDGCERTNEAYASQMQDDNSWTNDPQDPHFAACSGALLVHMVAQEQHGGQGPQINNVGTPNIMTMHAGGNNVDFGNVARNCIFQSPIEAYGPAYPDAAGKRKQAVDQANGRINDRGETSGLLYDVKRTIGDILLHDNIKDRPDFRLYVLGYIHFFNIDIPDSDWCNTVTFAPAGSYLGKQVLTQQLRADINDAVERVNKVMQEAAGSFDNRVGYIDLSPAYNTYRFCEKGATYNEQWYGKNVWLWNLNPPDDDPKNDEVNSPGQQLWLDKQQLPDGTPVTLGPDDIQPFSDYANGGPWQRRPFHPKPQGFEAMKNNIIDRLRADGLPGIKPVTPPAPAPVPAPYVDGPDKCHMHIWESWNCGDDATNLGVKVQIWDAAGHQMVFTDEIQAGDSSPASIFSPLPKVLVLTAEHRNDYIQFGYGATFWTSKDSDQSKDQWCSIGGWDPKEGPYCSSGIGSPFDVGPTQDIPSIKQMDCYFVCPWNNGSG